MSKKKVLIGYVGVDSGQVMICDPCYIDSEWDSQDGFNDTRRYKSRGSKKVYEYGKDFKSYDDILFDKKSVNDLIQDKQLVEVPNPVSHKFSYGGCCSQTLNKNGFGQLNYKLGHAGAGIVSSSGFGDGKYPVYAEIEDKGGGDMRVNKLTIEFMGTYTEEYVKGMKRKSKKVNVVCELCGKFKNETSPDCENNHLK